MFNCIMKDKEGRGGAVASPLLEQVVTNQGKSELANQGRHKIEEATADNRCDLITNQISKKAWLIIGCILGATVVLGGNSIRMHYAWSVELEETHKAFQQSEDGNRDLSLKYHKHREEREQGLRDKIDELHAELELEDQKKKHLAKQLNNFGDTINRLVSNAEQNKKQIPLSKRNKFNLCWCCSE